MSAPDRKGRMVVDGDGTVTLVFERVLHHTPQHIWDAISTSDGLRHWLMVTQATIDGVPGGRFDLVSGAGGYRSTGKILSWEPPKLLEYEWNVDPVPEMPRGEHAIFRYEIVPRDEDSTLLVVSYRRITQETARGFLPGLHVFLDRLEGQLAGEPLPDWMSRFAEVRTIYAEWTDHAPAAGK